MSKVDATVGRCIRICWAYMWRTLAIGFGIGLIFAVIGLSLRFSQEEFNGFNTAFGLIISFPIGVYVFKYILNMNFKGFKIVLVANQSEGEKENA